jgi:integrase
MRQVLGILEAMGVQGTDELTTAFIARFIAGRPAGEHPNTTFTLMTYLRAACNLAAAEGWVRVSPFAVRRRWLRRITPAAPKHHGREEIARVLDRARREIGETTGWEQWRARRTYALAATVAFTGLRRNEALHLHTEDTHRGHRPGQPDAADPLAGRQPVEDRGVGPAGPDPGRPGRHPRGLAGVHQQPGVGLPDGRCQEPLDQRRAGDQAPGPAQGPRPPGRAGVEGFTFQSLRHSWATHAEFWGLPDAMIQRVLRHTNTRTQHHYRHADAANLRAKVGRIDFGPPPPAAAAS